MLTDFSPQTGEGVIQVRDRQGIGLPFSKGLMVTSILATGVETDVAYRIAAAVEHDLRNQTRYNIEAEESVQLTSTIAFGLPA